MIHSAADLSHIQVILHCVCGPALIAGAAFTNEKTLLCP